MKTKLMRINGRQFGLVSAISIGLFSLIFIPAFILISIFGGDSGKYFWIIGICIPVFYFIFTYLLTRLYVWLFNTATRWIKGIEVDIENQTLTQIGMEEK